MTAYTGLHGTTVNGKLPTSKEIHDGIVQTMMTVPMDSMIGGIIVKLTMMA